MHQEPIGPVPAEASAGTGQDVTRRVVLRGAAVSGVAVPLLAACGSDTGGTGSSGSAGDEGSGDGGSDDGGSAGGTAVATSDVPVGGGTILAEDKVVVTQPSDGQFQAFSAVCTHQGCAVQSVSDGRINCPCHGSAFSIADGSVLAGPADAPLQRLSVSVEGDQVTVG
jgi:Rieske Fe-S protein